MFVHAIDALEMSGDWARAGAVAEEAYRRFSDHPDQPAAAVIHHRAARFRAFEDPAAGLPLIKESLRLFGQTPPSADHAEAWYGYGTDFLFHAEGRQEASLAAFNNALEIAEAAGATTLIPRILSCLAFHAFLRGQFDEGSAIIERERAMAEEAGDGVAALDLAICESGVLLTMARFRDAAEVGLRGLRAAGQSGLQAFFGASMVAANAAQALLARGRTADAAAVIDPLTAGPPHLDHWLAHECRAEIDLLRGDIDAADRRQQQIEACVGHHGSIDDAREAAQWAAEVALWAGRPGDSSRRPGGCSHCSRPRT